MTVTVNLRGGLGNQLFGWACGFALAQRLKANLELNAEYIPRIRGEVSSRQYGLDYFGISQTERMPKMVKFVNRSSKSGKIARTIRRETVFEEEGFAYDKRFESLENPVTISGYFQSKKYFAEAEESIRDLLLSNAKPSPELCQFRERLDHEWLAVHVRRGDYVKLREVYEIPGARYYQRAVALLKQVTGINQVVVFSDETVLAKKLGLGASEYLGPADLPHPGDNLLLMSEASGFAAANSSFSWWAAFLAEPKNRLNIFPRPWFSGDRHSTRDLLEPSWLTLGANASEFVA